MDSSPTDKYTRIERRIYGGREARVRLDPDEIHVSWHAGQPACYGVRVGDHVKDADRDVSSPRIAEWEVTEITPERVVGEHVESGERKEWERATLERGLVGGNYATNLSEFETVAVHRVGSWSDHDDRDDGRGYHGRPYVTVVVYGNNGEDYGRRYRFVEDGNETDVELREQDVSVERLPDELRERFDEVVRETLEAEEYVVHEREA